MKTALGRIAALLILVAILASVTVPAFAASYGYSTEKNMGTRDEVCTTLDDTKASEYYTGSYTYDNIASSSDILNTLRTLMTSTHKKQTSYANCRDYASRTDSENGNGKITTIYTSYQATTGEYNGGNGWNREHVWPKSLGGFNQDGAGADLHHIRPSENRTNSDRGNKLYGNLSSGTTSKGNLSGEVGGIYSGNYYEPNDNVKGDVARICLYVYVRWGATYSQSNNIKNVFQSVDVLLEWCELDPVDTWEMGRNEVVYGIQGNRNVFIDYPEFAWLLFGREVPTDMTTPSGLASGGNAGGSGSGNGGSGDGGNTGSGDSGSGDVTPPAGGPTAEAAPKADTAYKFGMVQENIGATYYLAGGMDGYYMATTTDYDSAIDVYLEATSGGYYLYTKSGNTKTYINMVVSGTHVNGAYESKASTVYTLTDGALTATVNGTLYHFGTRNDMTYDTIGPCKVSYGGFDCKFYTDAPTGGSGDGGNSGSGSGNTGSGSGDTGSGGSGGSGNTGSGSGGSGSHVFLSWSYSETKPEKSASCYICGGIKVEAITAEECAELGHRYGTVLKGERAATCSSSGYTGDKHCKHCDALVEKGSAIDSVEHVYGDPVTVRPATEEEGGLEKHACTLCGLEEVYKTPALEKKDSPALVIISASVGVIGIGAVAFFIIRRRKMV